MILTGKAKEDFEKWTQYEIDDCGNGQTGMRLFYIESLDDYKFIKTEHYIENLEQSMLNALIIEWFDSVGIYISISADKDLNTKSIDFLSFVGDSMVGLAFSRQEALIEAIKKANEIYNEK